MYEEYDDSTSEEATPIREKIMRQGRKHLNIAAPLAQKYHMLQLDDYCKKQLLSKPGKLTLKMYPQFRDIMFRSKILIERCEEKARAHKFNHFRRDLQDSRSISSSSSDHHIDDDLILERATRKHVEMVMKEQANKEKNKQSFFKSVTRDKRNQVFHHKTAAITKMQPGVPPVAHYQPNYEAIKRKSKSPLIQDRPVEKKQDSEEKSVCTKLVRALSRSQMLAKARSKRSSKQLRTQATKPSAVTLDNSKPRESNSPKRQPEPKESIKIDNMLSITAKEQFNTIHTTALSPTSAGEFPSPQNHLAGLFKFNPAGEEETTQLELSDLNAVQPALNIFTPKNEIQKQLRERSGFFSPQVGQLPTSTPNLFKSQSQERQNKARASSAISRKIVKPVSKPKSTAHNPATDSRAWVDEMLGDDFETHLDTNPSKSKFSQLGRQTAPAGRNGLMLQEKIRETLYHNRSRPEEEFEEENPAEANVEHTAQTRVKQFTMQTFLEIKPETPSLKIRTKGGIDNYAVPKQPLPASPQIKNYSPNLKKRIRAATIQEHEKGGPYILKGKRVNISSFQDLLEKDQRKQKAFLIRMEQEQKQREIDALARIQQPKRFKRSEVQGKMSLDLKFTSKKAKRSSPHRQSRQVDRGSPTLLRRDCLSSVKTAINQETRQQPRASMKRYMKMSRPWRKRMVFDYAKEDNLELLSKKSQL